MNNLYFSFSNLLNVDLFLTSFLKFINFEFTPVAFV